MSTEPWIYFYEVNFFAQFYVWPLKRFSPVRLWLEWFHMKPSLKYKKNMQKSTSLVRLIQHLSQITYDILPASSSKSPLLVTENSDFWRMRKNGSSQKFWLHSHKNLLKIFNNQKWLIYFLGWPFYIFSYIERNLSFVFI